MIDVQSEEQIYDIIFDQFEIILNDYYKKITEIKEPKEKEFKNININLFCKACLVILMETEMSNKNHIRFQSFRIHEDLLLSDVKSKSLEFWELQERADQFSLYFIYNNQEAFLIRKDEETMLVETFLKTKQNLKKAKFALVHYSFSNIN